MARSSGRGQVEPLTALAAVLAVGIGLALYGSVVETVVPESPDRRVPQEVLDRLLEPGFSPTVEPSRVKGVAAAMPSGWRANVTLASGGAARSVGPVPPTDALTTSRPVSVRVAAGRVRPGKLIVRVWQ